VVARNEEIDERLTNVVGTARIADHLASVYGPHPRRPMGVPA
jgi:hypothetical protein